MKTPLKLGLIAVAGALLMVVTALQVQRVAAATASCTRTSPTQLVCTGSAYENIYGPGCALIIDFSGPDWQFLSVDSDGTVNLNILGDAPIANNVLCTPNTGGGGGGASGDDDGDSDVAPLAGIWLADVCEPFAGFSGDGYLTLDTNADNLGYGTGLMAAASVDGPYIGVGVDGPQYAVSLGVAEQLEAQLGVAYTSIWVKAGEQGKPENLGQLIAARDARMDALCTP